MNALTTVGSPRRQRVRAMATRLSTVVLLASGVGGCGGPQPPPQPGENRGIPPDLRGRRVMLLPVQRVMGVAGDPTAELVFSLTERAADVTWILEDEVLEILDRSPAIQASTRGLPVELFLGAEVERVGDPLYGELRRMAALVDADVILLPVQASFEANRNIEGSVPKVRYTATVVEPRTGRVLWFGIEEGDAVPRGDPRGLASAAERLARTILWYGGA